MPWQPSPWLTLVLGMRPASVCGLKKSEVNIHNPPLEQAGVAALSAMLALLRISLARKSCARNFASSRGELQVRLRAWKASTKDAISFFADFPRKSHVLRRCAWCCSWRCSWRRAASTTLVMPSASCPACALSSTQIERANPCDGSLQSILLAAADLVWTCLPEDLPHRTDDGGRFSTSTYDLPSGSNGRFSCVFRAFLMNASAQQFDGFASTRVFLRMHGVHLDQ